MDRYDNLWTEVMKTKATKRNNKLAGFYNPIRIELLTFVDLFQMFSFNDYFFSLSYILTAARNVFSIWLWIGVPISTKYFHGNVMNSFKKIFELVSYIPRTNSQDDFFSFKATMSLCQIFFSSCNFFLKRRKINCLFFFLCCFVNVLQLLPKKLFFLVILNQWIMKKNYCVFDCCLCTYH